VLNSFFGLEMGLRALNYFRQGMDTAGHNISNADVEGYTRQRVSAVAADPYTEPGLSRPGLPGQIGTGVEIDSIERLRDLFLDAQYREESTVLGYWSQIQSAVSQVETFVNEPAGEGFQTSLDSFWTALQEAQKYPNDSSCRENLVQSAETMVTFLDQLQTNFDQYRTSLNKEVKLTVDEANSLIDQIAALNETIANVQGVGGNPNDLLDKRDLLTEKLCSLIDCTVDTCCSGDDDGDYKIDLHGKLLVQGDKTRHLVAVPVAGNGGFFDIQIEDNLYDPVSDPETAGVTIEQQAAEAVHSLEVKRLASETTWQVGKGDSLLSVTNPNQALGLLGSFGLQVGTNGVQKTSASFPAVGGNPVGTVLTAPGASDPTLYQFRLAAGNFESVVSVAWNSGTNQWDISDNLGSPATSTAGNTLNLTDLNGFINANYGTSLTSSVNGAGNQLTLASNARELLSVMDLSGGLTSALGLENASAPAVYIEVTESDTLTTIANKINSAYASDQKTLKTDPEGSVPDSPEEWLHASLVQKTDGSYYLLLESNQIGEANRINVLAGQDCGTEGSFFVARKLGLVDADDGTSFVQTSQDAYVIFDDKEYLSESNQFREAREVSGANAWAADDLNGVSTGLRFDLKQVGTTNITVRHAVKGGELLGMLEARDDFLLAQQDVFDEIAFEMSSEFNALHYAGHGTGDYSNVTGTAFFVPIGARYGASGKLDLNDELEAHSGLFAAASDDGTGKTLGVGDGSNALRMAQLKQAKVLADGTANFDSFYEAFIAELGATGDRANTMTTNQVALVGQIATQRQAVMGVNTDEEMLDIIQFQQAFNAMSRYITTVDEMLERIINGMGRVGL
jgi:flagellar hook-associated protein 1 FlgK